ncbi:MAG: PhnD/SsuA/transferrin family substrate-binding protein [Rhizobacter sp.]|nr:PhnD/SsuA/transferrin family substrate-binding protein [Bacteriovorax sp.]
MKDNNFMAIVIIIIASGAFYYNKIYSKNTIVLKKPIAKVIEKPIELKDAPHTEPVANVSNADRLYVVNSLIKEDSPISSDGDKNRTIDLFGTFGIKIKINNFILKPGFENAIFAKWEGDMGSSKFFTFMELIRAGKKLTPVFWTYGKNENTKCSYTLDVITRIDSKILKFKDLDKKQLAVIQNMNTNGPVIRAAFLDEKITARKINTDIDMPWLEKAISDGFIEAVVNVRQNIVSNTAVNATSIDTPIFGKYINGKFAAYPQLKLVDSKNVKIPCDLFFINQKVSDEEQLKIINAFRKVNQTSGEGAGAVYLSALGEFSSVEDIPTSDRTNIIDYINNYDKKDSYKDFTDEVVKVDQGKK